MLANFERNTELGRVNTERRRAGAQFGGEWCRSKQTKLDFLFKVVLSEALPSCRYRNPIIVMFQL